MLVGKIAIVTGAARGIGKATMELFVKHGAIVYGADIRQDVLIDSCMSCNERFDGRENGRAIAVPGDVTDSRYLKELFNTIKNAGCGLHILVNCAGIALSALMNMSSERDIKRNFEVNAIATIETIKHSAKMMAKNEIVNGNRGKIINISSIAGTNGNRGQIAYSGSKAAVIGITKSAAKELAPRLITCNAIAPGLIQTPMLDEALTPQIIQDYLDNSVLMKRLGTVCDIANAIMFFASDYSNYVTGQILGVDGGYIL